MDVVDQIRDAAQDYSVPLEAALLKCMVLAADVDYEPLLTWATKEVEGYEDASDLPNYRVVQVGRSRAQVSNGVRTEIIVVDPIQMPVEIRDRLSHQGIWQPVSAIESTSQVDTPHAQWPGEFRRMLEARLNRYSVQEAWFEFSSASFVGILSVIRSRVLRFSFEIAKQQKAQGAAGQDLTSLGSVEMISRAFQDIITLSGTSLEGAGDVPND